MVKIHPDGTEEVLKELPPLVKIDNRGERSMELRVFSTVSGNLPLMVKNQEAACFVPYEQAVELQAQVAEYRALLEEALNDIARQCERYKDVQEDKGP